MSVFRCNCSELLVDTTKCEMCGREYTKCSNCGLYKCYDEVDDIGICFSCLEYLDNYQRVEEKEGLVGTRPDCIPEGVLQPISRYTVGPDADGDMLTCICDSDTASVAFDDIVNGSHSDAKRFAIIMEDATARTLSLLGEETEDLGKASLFLDMVKEDMEGKEEEFYIDIMSLDHFENTLRIYTKVCLGIYDDPAEALGNVCNIFAICTEKEHPNPTVYYTEYYEPADVYTLNIVSEDSIVISLGNYSIYEKCWRCNTTKMLSQCAGIWTCKACVDEMKGDK